MNHYEDTIQALRTRRDEHAIAAPLNWMNLAGLFWLEEGENSFGSSPENEIHLPSLPMEICGSFQLKNGKVFLHPAESSRILLNVGAPDARPLFTDEDEKPDLIDLGAITMKIILRGGIPMVRAWDREAPSIKNFTGFHYYSIKPEYCIQAVFTRYSPPRQIKVMDAIGNQADGEFAGQASFTLNGVECTLEAERSGEELLFNFKDLSNNETTYGGGRRLITGIPDGEEILLDFNLAENWPCAYTPFATCPIPPKENRLPVKIEAGEMKYHD